MSIDLIVVNNPKRWTFEIPNVDVVSAKDYLTLQKYGDLKRARVVNLCRSYGYQSIGYYVSLLAEARGHRPMPSVATTQDFKAPTLARAIAWDIERLIQKTLAPLQSDKFILSVYFGKNMAKRYDSLCRQLLALFPAPTLRASFTKENGQWTLQNISPVASRDIPESHRDFVIESAKHFFSRRRPIASRKQVSRFDLAILVDPDEQNPPSNEGALRHFEKAAEKLGILTERIGVDDYDRIGEFDGLFIRATTAVNHYTYRFARRAEAEGMTVLDDPLSILRCTNKVFLSELLNRHHVPTPKTIIIHSENIEDSIETLGLPCILKVPDSAFSLGVKKVTTEDELRKQVAGFLEDSELVLAQEFMPTSFDWRIGILNGSMIYACRYHMAKGHWQIYNHGAKKQNREGNADSFQLSVVPQSIRNVAIEAANLIGKGLYGVDLKDVDGKAYVIEVNDNPNLDEDIEDGIASDDIYGKIMNYFLTKMEERRMHS